MTIANTNREIRNDAEVEIARLIRSRDVIYDMYLQAFDRARRAEKQRDKLREYIIQHCWRCGGTGCAECYSVVGMMPEQEKVVSDASRT